MSTMTMTGSRSPKLLPWLAKKAGIAESRAHTLWHEASRHAAARATPNTSAYFKLAVDRLLELVAAESLRADAASFGWRPWSRAQRRLWSATLQAMEACNLLLTRSLHSLSRAYQGQRYQQLTAPAGRSVR